jgi:hypothetical protein
MDLLDCVNRTVFIIGVQDSTSLVILSLIVAILLLLIMFRVSTPFNIRSSLSSVIDFSSKPLLPIDKQDSLRTSEVLLLFLKLGNSSFECLDRSGLSPSFLGLKLLDEASPWTDLFCDRPAVRDYTSSPSSSCMASCTTRVLVFEKIPFISL